MDRSHYCFNCEQTREPEELDICNDLGHDIDVEDSYTPPNHDSELRESTDDKTKLLEFAEKNIKQVFVSSTDSSQFYGIVEVDGHKESINLNSDSAISWLKVRYYETCEKFHGHEMYENVISLIRDKSSFSKDIEPTPISKRIFSDNKSIYIDLASPDWNLVKITENETSIVPHGNDTPIFARSKSQSRIPEPNFEYTGNPLDEFTKLVRMDNESIFKEHLICEFLAHVPTPIVVIIGQEDSAKSDRSALIKMLVDPSGTELDEQLGQFGRNDDDLNVRFANNYMAVFDNLSDITGEQSDSLCKAVTGASYSKRQNYSDADEIVLKFQRKIVLNGISVNIEHSDLARRSIHYFTERIPTDEKLTRSQVMDRFKEILPDLYGQIFFVLSEAIQYFDIVIEDTKTIPGMAEFAVWGECISRALGHDEGVFLKNYSAKLEHNSDLLNENNCIISFLEDTFEGQNATEMTYQNGKWFNLLESYAVSEGIDKKSRNYPKSSAQLKSWINRSKPLLHQHHWEIKFEKNTSHKEFTRNATLMKVRKIIQQESLS
ncbi:MAG: hypothetical protein ACW9XA_09035 [Candidatus Nitrosopumilus sp. bin_6a]